MATIVGLLFSTVAFGASDSGTPGGERPKDALASIEQKKKSDADATEKADKGAVPPVEQKKKSDDAKSVEPASKTAADEKSDKGTSSHSAEPKKKSDHDGKQIEPASKTATDEKSDKSEKADKNSKSEEAESPAQKHDEPSGKKPVTSINLTIKLALMADPILFPYEFEVDVSHEKAVVTGSVPTEEDKSRVTDVVKTVEGIESVTNKVTVSPALRASLTKQQDEAIAQFVKERLNRSETLKAVGFDVKSDQGVVSLSGKTRFQVIALEAAEAARHIPGVRAVNTTAVQITGKE
ncbi:MAG TPA: BON domain-containing protein [Nitrospiraceae bacterium]